MSRNSRHAPPRSAGAASSKALPSRVRIIGGQWRGVRIDFPPLPALRPSPDRVRETLFNWLRAPIPGARCLDLFTGSGVIGIEALSRGAAHVDFVDSESAVIRHLRDTLQRLKTTQGFVHHADALRYLAGTPSRYDVVFLDPPYASEVLLQACNALARGWLAEGAHLYLECAADKPLPVLPPGWQVLRSKRAGQVGYHLLRAGQAGASTKELQQ